MNNQQIDKRIALADQIIIDLAREGHSYGEIKRIAEMVVFQIQGVQAQVLKQIPPY